MIRVCSCRVLNKTLTILGEKLKPSEYNVNSWFRIKICFVNCPAVSLLTLDNTNPMKFHAYCPTPIRSLCAINIFLAIIKQILNSMFSLPNVSYKAPLWSEQSMEVTRCESLVLEAVNTSPLVKTLISALNRAGCDFSTVRHIACEPLPPGMLGGFDKDLNQVTPQKDWRLITL